MRIALLSNNREPLLGYQIAELLKQNTAIHAILMDSKVMSDKDLQIFQERTAGHFPEIPLHQFAKEGIPFYFVDDHRSPITAALVARLNIDLLINAGTPRILTNTILRAPRVGVVNCHPGLLPQFRGCTCVEWAVYLDEQIGNTVHFMTEGIDEGPIVLQEGLTFRRTDTYVDVRVKVYQHALHLLAKGVRRIVDEGLSVKQLPAQGSGRYFKVIESKVMEEVVQKLALGRYAYQR